MRKRTRVLTSGLLAVILVLAVAVGVSATSGTKNISALFRNIHIVANGKTVVTDTEPFIVNGRTYVPLRTVSEALGAWVDWNQANSMVTIKGGTNSAEVDILKAQIAAKDTEIANLKAQLDAKDDDKKAGSLSNLEKELNQDYDELKDVDIGDIRLTGDEDSVSVTIEVDLDDYDREWKKLSDSDIKTWLNKICLDIQDYYDNDTDVSGRIRDTDSRDTLITFSKDGRRAISVSFRDDDYRDSEGDVEDVEKDLKGDTYTVGGMKFKITKIDYLTRTDTIEVEMASSERDGEMVWDSLSKSLKTRHIEGICEELVDEFEAADVDPRYVDISFYDDYDDLLDDYEYNVRDDELR